MQRAEAIPVPPHLLTLALGGPVDIRAWETEIAAHGLTALDDQLHPSCNVIAIRSVERHDLLDCCAGGDQSVFGSCGLPEMAAQQRGSILQSRDFPRLETDGAQPRVPLWSWELLSRTGAARPDGNALERERV